MSASHLSSPARCCASYDEQFMAPDCCYTLPLAMSREGWPIGVQFVGRDCDEAGLLRLATQLEAAQPWANRKPAL